MTCGIVLQPYVVGFVFLSQRIVQERTATIYFSIYLGFFYITTLQSKGKYQIVPRENIEPHKIMAGLQCLAIKNKNGNPLVPI